VIWVQRTFKSFGSENGARKLFLTESQLSALERAKKEKEAHWEIETEHLGYLGAHDIYVGEILKVYGNISVDIHRHLFQNCIL